MRAVTWLLATALVVLLAAPLLALAASSVGPSFARGISDPLVAPAIRLSLFTTAVSAAIVITFGTALAWRIARSHARWVRAVELLVQLPIVVPPAVAGVALLLTFGRHGVFGSLFGGSLAFTTGAVILAEVFVSAPFFLQAALSAFRRIDEDLLVVARSLGASRTRVFVRVVLPMALPALAGGAAMSWARALGEFGATLMFAGNMTGRTQTLPLAIYTAMETDLDAAKTLSLLLVVVATLVIALVRVTPTVWGVRR